MAGGYTWYGSDLMQRGVDENCEDSARAHIISGSPCDQDYEAYSFLQSG